MVSEQRGVQAEEAGEGPQSAAAVRTAEKPRRVRGESALQFPRYCR